MLTFVIGGWLRVRGMVMIRGMVMVRVALGGGLEHFAIKFIVILTEISCLNKSLVLK